MMLVLGIMLLVQLDKTIKTCIEAGVLVTHHFKNRYFHHALIEIRGFVFHDLHRNDFMGLHVLAFDHLTKRALPKYIQNEISCGQLGNLLRIKNRLTYLFPFSDPNQSLT